MLVEDKDMPRAELSSWRAPQLTCWLDRAPSPSSLLHPTEPGPRLLPGFPGAAELLTGRMARGILSALEMWGR